MKVTKDLLEALLVRGWEIKYKRSFLGQSKLLGEGHFEYRSPSGMSGDTYVCSLKIDFLY